MAETLTLSPPMLLTNSTCGRTVTTTPILPADCRDAGAQEAIVIKKMKANIIDAVMRCL
jgi:hypothetical protein